jgi:hypothetical protein
MIGAPLGALTTIWHCCRRIAAPGASALHSSSDWFTVHYSVPLCADHSSVGARGSEAGCYVFLGAGFREAGIVGQVWPVVLMGGLPLVQDARCPLARGVERRCFTRLMLPAGPPAGWSTLSPTWVCATWVDRRMKFTWFSNATHRCRRKEMCGLASMRISYVVSLAFKIFCIVFLRVAL